MKRDDLLDKILDTLYTNPDKNFNLYILCKENYKIESRHMIKSIYEELINREWAAFSHSHSQHVSITQKGLDMLEKYGSYTKFKKSEDRAKKWSAIKNKINFMVPIIALIITIYPVFSEYKNYQTDKKIDTLQTEIHMLKVAVDSLKTELNTRSEKMAIIQSSDSIKTNSNVDREAGDVPKAVDSVMTTPNLSQITPPNS